MRISDWSSDVCSSDLRRSISHETRDGEALDDHYTLVTLHGLSETPAEMKDIASLGDYLRMVAPVDYKSHWAPGEEIKRHAENIGQTIPTVPVFLGPPDEPGEELRKPYQQTIHAGSKPATIRRINFFNGGEASGRSEEHTSELQSLMRISYAVFCLKKKNTQHIT